MKKECTGCKISKELTEFSKNKTTKDGFQYSCKQCRNGFYLDNIDRYKKYNRQRYSTNPEKWKNTYNPEYMKQYRESLKDGLHHVYLLVDYDYVGVTDCIYTRMGIHRRDGRDTSNYQILNSFTDREDALRFEEMLHAEGYKGRHTKRSWK